MGCHCHNARIKNNKFIIRIKETSLSRLLKGEGYYREY